MILTNKQEEGLKIAVQRYKDHEKYTVISGYAGTGKSTLVRFIIDALPVAKDKVCYATFTGKAAEVLRKKGNKNTLTLHKLLYNNIMLPAGGYMRKPKPELEYTIVVVDEVSMVPKDMIDLLFSHKCYVICLGDPFQLPPINKDSDNHLLDHPHVFLDEIMRQAAENEIIRVSMDIRQNYRLPEFNGNDVKVVPRKDYDREMLTWADQVLVATNNSRANCNKTVRVMLDRGPLPEDGDKVVCLENYWETCSTNGNPLVNGTIGYLKKPVLDTYITLHLRLQTNPILYMTTDIITEDGDKFCEVYTDQQKLITGSSLLEWKDKYTLAQRKYRIGDWIPRELDYGYAITCHKAQGSQWQKVFILEESFPFTAEEHARWLYTAITRAEEQVIIVRN